MGALFIFIFISILIISALLFFNKGEKAQEIKSILKDIYENFVELFSNLKKLFLILKELIQAKLDTEPTQLKDDSSSDNSPKSETFNQSENPINDSSTDPTEPQADVSTSPETLPAIEVDNPTDNSISENSMDTKND